ncbi:MAG TPA: HEAT repeat domain-containing protein [Planctomycetota bacterium]|jgi:hypothetical protein|nr:HEAT repeat domain-containing protein [Planctomycetota bacterium]
MNRQCTGASERGALCAVVSFAAAACGVLHLAGCAANVNDYLVEAQKGDPESVKEAVVMVGRLLKEKEESGAPFSPGDEEALQYLVEVASQGPDAVNRASAIDSLSRLKSKNFSELYAQKLEDKAWIVQLEAARALARNPSATAVESLVKALDSELRMEVRLEVLKTLAATGGDEALHKLLDSYLDTSRRYQYMKLTAYDGIRRWSGKTYGPEERELWEKYRKERFPEPAKETLPSRVPEAKPEPEKPSPEKNG